MKPALGFDEMTAATRGYVGGRRSLISCMSSFSFRFTNSQRVTQLHTISIIFYFPLLRSSVAEIHILFIMEAAEKNVPACQTFGAKGWKRAQALFSRLPGWADASPLKREGSREVTQDLGGDTGRGSSACAALWASAPHAGTLGMKKEMNDRTLRDESL